jgi:hypothetical protein
MANSIRTSLLALTLLCIPACSGGGIDSRNKDLDRPKAAEEKAAVPANQKPATPANEKTPAAKTEKPATPAKK